MKIQNCIVVLVTKHYSCRKNPHAFTIILSVYIHVTIRVIL